MTKESLSIVRSVDKVGETALTHLLTRLLVLMIQASGVGVVRETFSKMTVSENIPPKLCRLYSLGLVCF